MLRTAQNLLNLKEPILSESKQSFASSADSTKDSTFRCSTPTFPVVAMQRKLNSRESRLSIQSSTDDSVHSTSSSHNETDEENTTPLLPAFCIMPTNVSKASSTNRTKTSVASSVDDESGFSSMNSFQEIGLPHQPLAATQRTPTPRTRLSTSTDTSSIDRGSPNETDDDSNSTKNCTVRMRTSPARTLPICHRRWSSAPPVPPKRNLSTFNGDEPLKVLWV